MAGNVWEWTLGREEFYSPYRVMRGGAAYSTSDDLLTFRRQGAPPGGSNRGALNMTGFRCVKSLEAEEPKGVLDYLEFGSELALAAESCQFDRYDIVRDSADRLLKLNPRSIPGNYWKAASLAKDGKVAAALAAMKVVSCQKPDYRYTARDLKQYIQFLGPNGFLRYRTQFGGLFASSSQGSLVPILTWLGVKPDPAASVATDFLRIPGLLRRADAAIKMKKYSEAESLLQGVLNLDPENGAAEELLGLLCEATQRLDEARRHFDRRIQDFRAQLREDPGDANLCNTFAWFLGERRLHLDEALTLAKRAVELEPDIAAYLDTLAELHHLNNQRAEAVSMGRQAVELAPEEEYYRKQLEKFEAAPTAPLKPAP
jgi:tetratricopeptide (TPR) repeat protein